MKLTIGADYFSVLCTVHADTSQVAKRKQFGIKGAFYQQDFKVFLLCGQTEMKAQISWMENVSIFSSSRRLPAYYLTTV